jgi:quercetin dioxygenase-like cupin family protein
LRIRLFVPLLSIPVLVASSELLGAQRSRQNAMQGFGVCIPRAQRRGKDVGCFIITDKKLGVLGPAPMFWHVSRLSSRRVAEALVDARSTVIDAFGSTWLVTIADRNWRSKGGEPVTNIGPLPIQSRVAYSALYMEASMRPGMKSAIHRHSGPEAWYTLQGETCLETSQGTQVGRAGGPPVIMPGGLPMELTATGTMERRSLVLILHDSSKPPTMRETTWSPRGLCKP